MQEARKWPFPDWKGRVSVHLEALCGASADELPDWDYWCAWEEGLTPKKAACMAYRDMQEM